MDAKADLWALLTAIGVPLEALQVTADAPSFLHPGRSGMVRQGPKTVLGLFGEVHPRLLAAIWTCRGRWWCSSSISTRSPIRNGARKSAPDLPAFQPVRRDFAFVVEADVAADAVMRAARGAERTLDHRGIAVRRL